MYTRFMLRIVATLAAVVAGVAVSARAALAVAAPQAAWVAVVDPIGGPPGVDTGASPQAAGASPDALVILGVDWELGVAIVLFVLAVAFFVAGAAQRRHVAQA